MLSTGRLRARVLLKEKAYRSCDGLFFSSGFRPGAAGQSKATKPPSDDVRSLAWPSPVRKAIVFETNLLTDLIQQPYGAQHRKGGGFMAEFSNAFSYSTRATKLGYKPLAVFPACQFRPQAPDMACRLVQSTFR